MLDLRLISDGTPGGVKIIDINTGERLRRVKSFEFKWTFKEFATLTVETVIADQPLFEKYTEKTETVVSVVK